jgi:CubicO group peptidase (beta-lactamase class C family)
MSSTDYSSKRRTFLQSIALGMTVLPMESFAMTSTPTPSKPIGRKLPRVRPEAVGIQPEGVLAFIDAVEKKVGGLHSFMLMRHGKVASEGWWAPYTSVNPHMLFSLSKSFTSTGIGLAVSEGILNTEDTVVSFFPNDLPEKVSDNLAAMRIKHLLMMGTGHDKDTLGGLFGRQDGDWVRGFLSLPVEHTPGSKFVYNSGATYMLSAILQKKTGTKLLDFLIPRLFAPLGITDMTWETCPKGINTGGWGLKVKTEDIARFGQTYLQKGEWEGKQVIPSAWVQEATAKHISNGDPANPNDWSQGYGYQFWRCRHDGFRGDGAFGQYCIVLPKLDTVIAITSGVGDMQAVLNAVWDNLIPAIQPEPLPESGIHSTLKERLAGLAITPPQGKTTSPTTKKVSGRLYQLEENSKKYKSLQITFAGGKATLIIKDEKGEKSIGIGQKSWVKSEASLSLGTSDKIACRGAWKDEKTYTVTVCAYETPFIMSMDLAFDGDTVSYAERVNVSFAPPQAQTIKGRAS